MQAPLVSSFRSGPTGVLSTVHRFHINAPPGEYPLPEPDLQ